MSDLLVSCRDPANRYKNQFTSSPAHYRFEGFTHKESYTPPNSCVDACNAATVGTPLFESCRTGSIAACKTISSTNLDQCFSDKCKYAELDTVLNAWCTANPNDVNYYKYCRDTPMPADKLATLKELTTIDSDFIYYVVDGLTKQATTKPLLTLLGLQPSFTAPQLEMVFNAAKTPTIKGLLAKWQDLYAKARNVSKLPTAPPKSFPGQGDPDMTSMNTTVIVSTSTGLLIISGDFAFPYTSTGPLSYDAKDNFWAQLLISATVIDGNGKISDFKFIDTKSDIINSLKAEMDNHRNNMTDIHSDMTIAITGLPAPANAYVMYRNKDRAKYVAWLQRTMAGATGASLNQILSTSCAAMADACFDRDLATIQNNAYGPASNLICDKASSPTTGETDDTYYSSGNAKTLLNACAIAYSTSMCNAQDKRYKSAFTNRPKPSTHHSFEGFSHKEGYSTGCADACTAATAGTPLFESCRAGSLAYCNAITDTNLDQCFADKCKYAELDTVLNSWCDANKTHAKYAQYCAPPPPPPQVPTPAPTTPTTIEVPPVAPALTDKNDATTAAPGIDSIVPPSQPVTIATPIATTTATPTPITVPSLPIPIVPTTTTVFNPPAVVVSTTQGSAKHKDFIRDNQTVLIIIGVIIAFVVIVSLIAIFRKRAGLSAFRYNYRMPRYGRGDA
jgi:hypothetical protein